MEERRFSQLMELSIMALMNPLFMNDPQRATETDFICLTACLLNRTSHYAYNFIREICVKVKLIRVDYNILRENSSRFVNEIL